MDMGNFGNKLMERMFKPVPDAVWDLMSGTIGIHTDDGICSISKNDAGEYEISLNVFDDISIPIPAFAQNTNVKDIKEGDLIYTNKKVLGWVTEIISEGKFRILKKDGTSSTWQPPKVQMLGLADSNGALVLRSLINILPGGSSGLGDMKNMLMPMLMMGGNLNMEKMIPMMLMTSMGGSGTAGMSGMMPMLMMMNMMGGNNPNQTGNPLTNMFGGNKGNSGNFFDGRNK